MVFGDHMQQTCVSRRRLQVYVDMKDYLDIQDYVDSRIVLHGYWPPGPLLCKALKREVDKL